MTARARWLLAACLLATIALAFILDLSRIERRWDSQGIAHLPVAAHHPRRVQ